MSSPGPWRVGNEYGLLQTEVVSADGGQVVALVFTRKFGHNPDTGGSVPKPWPEGLLNLSMIISASKMLAALVRAEEQMEQCVRLVDDPEFHAALEDVRAAISESGGQ